MWSPDVRQPSGRAGAPAISTVGWPIPAIAKFRNVPHGRQPEEEGSPRSKRLLEGRFVGRAIRRRHMPHEIDDAGAERELGAVGILEPELAVSDDAGTVESS